MQDQQIVEGQGQPDHERKKGQGLKFQFDRQISIGTDAAGAESVSLRVYVPQHDRGKPKLRCSLVRNRFNQDAKAMVPVEGHWTHAAVYLEDIDPQKLYGAVVSLRHELAERQRAFQEHRRYAYHGGARSGSLSLLLRNVGGMKDVVEEAPLPEESVVVERTRDVLEDVAEAYKAEAQESKSVYAWGMELLRAVGGVFTTDQPREALLRVATLAVAAAYAQG